MGLKAAILLILAVAAAAGCARGGGGEAATGPSRRVGAVFEGEPRGPLGEGVYAALERAVRERGGRIATEAGTSPRVPAGLDLRCLSSKLEGRDDEQLLRVLADDGRDLVIASGSRFAPALSRVAREFPRVRFALIGAPRGSGDGSPNIAYLSFADEEGAFLVGALAALMATGRPGARLGFVGGADAPPAHAYQAGFQAGAAYAVPSFRRPGALLAQYCGRHEGAYSDPAVAEAIAASQYKKGAALVFHAAGASGQGVYAAARRFGALAMGSGGDVPGGTIAATAVERGGAAAALLVDELFSTGSLRSGPRLLGVKEGAVGCELDAGSKDGPSAYAPRLEELRALIAAGGIAVPSDDESAARFIKELK
jgi:basic membrane protein A and related proteins